MMSICTTIVWIVTCCRKKSEPSTIELTPPLSPIISFPDNPTFPVADSTRCSETDVEPVITGGDVSGKVHSLVPKVPTATLPVIEVNINATNEEKKCDSQKEDMKSACIYLVKPQRKYTVGLKKEVVKTSPKEENSDRTQSSEERELITAKQITAGIERDVSKRSERKAIDRVGGTGSWKNKSVKIMKDLYRIGVQKSRRKIQSPGAIKRPDRCDSQRLMTARAGTVVLQEGEPQQVETGKGCDELVEKLLENDRKLMGKPMEDGCNEKVWNAANDRSRKEESKTAKSVSRIGLSRTQSPHFISERTQSTRIFAAKTPKQ